MDCVTSEATCVVSLRVCVCEGGGGGGGHKTCMNDLSARGDHQGIPEFRMCLIRKFSASYASLSPDHIKQPGYKFSHMHLVLHNNGMSASPCLEHK